MDVSNAGGSGDQSVGGTAVDLNADEDMNAFHAGGSHLGDDVNMDDANVEGHDVGAAGIVTPPTHGVLFEFDDVHRICCIGAGRTGVFSMLVLADKWPEKQFFIVDTNVDLIMQWRSNQLPYHEPDLDERVAAQRGNNLFFEVNIELQIQQAQAIFIAVDVPTKLKGEGKKGRLDLTDWERAVRFIGEYANGSKYIIEKSTMPLEIPNKIFEILADFGQNHRFDIFYNPEFFSQGTALKDLEVPDRVIIGSKGDADTRFLRDLYGWVDNDRIISVNDSRAVELSKVGSNAFMALKATFMHTMTTLCDSVGTDIHDVRNILIGDRRIGQEFFDPGISFGGRGLNKDVAYLAYIADFYKLDCEAKFFKSIIKLNQKRKERFVEAILTKMVSLRGKIFAIYGFSYKVNTDDIRDSAAIYVCQRLLEEGVEVRVYDPVVPHVKIRSCFSKHAKLSVVDSVEGAWAGANAACFLVPWPAIIEKVNESLGQMYDDMKEPAFFIDGCNSGYDYMYFKTRGFKVYVPGSPKYDA